MASIRPVPPIRRFVDLSELVGKKSYFLFGPRQTGKSFLIGQSLPGARVYDLLDSSVFLSLSQRPVRLSEELAPGDRVTTSST